MTLSFQAKLTTKLVALSVDNTVIELKANVDSEKLNEIVKSLLKQLDKVNSSEYENKIFDFIVGGRILRQAIDKHLEHYSGEVDVDEILSENLVEVEYILSAEPPKPLDTVPHEDWVSAVDADTRYIVSGSYDNSIRILSANDRSLLITIPNAHQKPIMDVIILCSSKKEVMFISCGHDELAIERKVRVDTKKYEISATFKGHTRSVNCMDKFGKLVGTGSFDKTFRLWEHDGPDDTRGDITSGAKKRKTVDDNEKKLSSTQKRAQMTLTGHHESITGVKFLNGCHDYFSAATCSMDSTIIIWDIEVGESKQKLLSSKPLLDIDYSKEMGIFLSASCDRHIRTWDSRAPDNSTAKTAYTSHSAWVSKVSFGQKNPNHFISGGYDNLVKLWDLRSPKACLYDLIGHHDKVLDVTWNNPDYVFSGSADSTLKIFATE